MVFSSRLTNKSMFKSSNDGKKKQKQLERFVIDTPGFNRHSYGEIHFAHRGNLSTYSPFVTVTPEVRPDMMWKLLHEKWELAEPNAIVALAGEFERSDSEWMEVVDQAWLITNGSAPCQNRSSNSYMIAIIPLSKVSNKGSLFSELSHGSFPLIEIGATARNSGDLDVYHTHFILVDGDLNDAVKIRQTMLDFIGNLRQNDNHSETECSTIPIVNVMISEDEEAWKIISVASKNSSFPTVVADTAPSSFSVVQNYVCSGENVEIWKFSTDPTCDSTFEQAMRDKVEETINKWIKQPESVTLYSRADETLTEALMKAMINSTAFSRCSIIHMAVAWNMMDIIKKLLHSWKEIKKEHFLAYLSTALTYDSAEFLEYFEELGINISSSLNIRLLHSLYSESLHNKQFETPTSFIVRKMLNNRFPFGCDESLYSIGRIISNLTNHEVSGLYLDKISRERFRDEFGSKKLLLSPSKEDEDSKEALYPERDLFLWSIFFGKYKIAAVFWKQCQALGVLSLIASAVIKGEAHALSASTFDDALAEDLSERAKCWTSKSVDLIQQSYKHSRKLTLSYLTMPVDNYGGCKILNLAYFTRQIKFFAQPPLQDALDSIWLGKTKKDTARWRTLVAIVCPLLVPWLDIVRKSDTLEHLKAQGMVSTMAARNDEKHQSRQRNGTRIVIEDRNASAKRKSKRIFTMNRFKRHCKTIYDYYNSPVVKFWVHLMFLCIAIVFSGLILSDGSRAYASKNVTCRNASNGPMSPPQNLNPMNLPVLFLLMAYILGIAVDEMRQIYTANTDSFRGRFEKWSSSCWNIVDLVTFVSFMIGELIYALSEKTCASKIAFQIFFSISLGGMLLRFFQSYYAFRYIGPKVFMIKEMMKDLSVFLYIMIPVFLCYGTILSSFMGDFQTLESHGPLSWMLDVYNFAFYRPFWQLFGSATEDAVRAQKTIHELATVLLIAAYSLFSNILMVNLLIAMFSYTFEQIQENANEYWKYQRFQLVQEFRDRPVLPSPLIIIENLLYAIQCYKDNNAPADWKKLENFDTKFEQEDVWNFEKEVLQELLKSEQKNTLTKPVE